MVPGCLGEPVRTGMNRPSPGGRPNQIFFRRVRPLRLPAKPEFALAELNLGPARTGKPVYLQRRSPRRMSLPSWATALLLAERGVKVVLGARRSDRLRALADRIAAAGDEAAWAVTDVKRRDVYPAS